jgi:hypothetical protein
VIKVRLILFHIDFGPANREQPLSGYLLSDEEQRETLQKAASKKSAAGRVRDYSSSNTSASSVIRESESNFAGR